MGFRIRSDSVGKLHATSWACLPIRAGSAKYESNTVPASSFNDNLIGAGQPRWCMLVSRQVHSLPCVQPLACRDLTHGHVLLAFLLALVIRGRGADGIDGRTWPQFCGASCFILTGSFRRSCNDPARFRPSRIIKSHQGNQGATNSE